ncbi:hypothetical protein HZS_4322 [Henneguya salminicola]|nr:hypothetical protein HZS_4322 [Henneguya salminicola]
MESRYNDFPFGVKDTFRTYYDSVEKLQNENYASICINNIISSDKEFKERCGVNKELNDKPPPPTLWEGLNQYIPVSLESVGICRNKIFGLIQTIPIPPFDKNRTR